jgi:hypothetical protein
MKLWRGQPDNWKPQPPRAYQVAVGVALAALFGYSAFTDLVSAADVCANRRRLGRLRGLIPWPRTG